MWEIWKSRNEFSFQGNKTHINVILQRIEKSVQDQSDFEIKDLQDLEFLHPPENEVSAPPGYKIASLGRFEIGTTRFTVQVDGAWNKNTRRRGAGWVIEYDGKVTELQGCSYGIANSALQAEAIACLEALQWCWEAGIQSLIIKTDASMLVDILQRKDLQEKSILWTIDEIGKLGKNLTWCIIRKEQRSKVEEAHKLAKMATTNAIVSRPNLPFVFNFLE